MKNKQEIQPDAHAAAAEGQTTLVFLFKGWNLSVTISDIRSGVCFTLRNHCLIWTPGVRVTFRLVVMSSFIVISQTWKASVASSGLMLISVCAEIWCEMWHFCYVLPKRCPASQGLRRSSRPKNEHCCLSHHVDGQRCVCVCVRSSATQHRRSRAGLRSTTRRLSGRVNLQILQIPTQHLLS